MLEKIYSKTNPEKLLHIIFRSRNAEAGRIDISPVSEFLQLSALMLDNKTTFRPHKHIPCEKKCEITQECWVVIRGKVLVTHFDTNGEFLCNSLLELGDVTVTFYGGHTYTIMEDSTLVIEVKNGPYNGQALDKEFIN